MAHLHTACAVATGHITLRVMARHGDGPRVSEELAAAHLRVVALLAGMSSGLLPRERGLGPLADAVAEHHQLASGWVRGGGEVSIVAAMLSSWADLDGEDLIAEVEDFGVGLVQYAAIAGLVEALAA